MPTDTLKDADAIAEEIAARDNNNLYMTSRYFVDIQKYRAFCALYAVMRVVDDRIDAIPSRADLSSRERRVEHLFVERWEEAVQACYAGDADGLARAAAALAPPAPQLLQAFSISLDRFPVPAVLWENFFKAMHRDIERPRFANYEEFLEYAEGATVAPTTIYLFLLASRSSGETDRYLLPEGFDLFDCGRQLGLFAYLAHIMRDLAQDLATGKEGLLYFAADDMERHGVTEEMLFADLERNEASTQVRALIAELEERACAFLAAGRALMEPLSGALTADCAFILDLIVMLYQRVIEKIAACAHDPLMGKHLLSSAEKQQLVFELKTRRWRKS